MDTAIFLKKMSSKKSYEKNRSIEFLFYKIYHFLFSERFSKEIDYNFDNSKTRLDLIQYLINKNNYKSYLEIGCDTDQIFSKINISKIGVDPVSGGNYRGTSDQFFEQNKAFFDCIFIDGLHEYNQVIKDIKNSLSFLNKDGCIILHDCLPKKISNQYVPRCRYKWNGDVWKAIVEMRTLENLNIYTLLIDQGVSVIKKEKNGDLLNIKYKNFSKLKFKYFYYNYSKIMRTVSFNDFIHIVKKP